MEKRINIFISGSTNPNISKEYKQAAIEFGKLLDTKKHNIIFDGCHGLPSIVASQLSQPNDNLIIAYTTSHNIPISDWPLATRNGTFSYQSEVTRALLDWSDVAFFFFREEVGLWLNFFMQLIQKRMANIINRF